MKPPATRPPRALASTASCCSSPTVRTHTCVSVVPCVPCAPCVRTRSLVGVMNDLRSLASTDLVLGLFSLSSSSNFL
jgi:hypothetical protein